MEIMNKVYVTCPHCGEGTEASYNLDEIDKKEEYHNECYTCYGDYTITIKATVKK